MTKLKLFLTLLALALATTLSYSQELTPPKRNGVSIGETKVSMGKDVIIIDYRILLGEDVRSCKVGATMYLDGRPFRKATEFSGDIGNIMESGPKRIRYDLSGRKERLAGKDISFRLDVSDKKLSYNIAATVTDGGNVSDSRVSDWNISEKKGIGTKCLISAHTSPLINTMSSHTSIPTSYGVMVGVVKKVGGYVSFRSNYKFAKADHFVYSYSELTSPTSKTITSVVKASGGILFRANESIYPYTGVGYGFNDHLYLNSDNSYSGSWWQIKDLSRQGLVVEAGVVSKFGPIAFSVGVCTIKFKTVSLDLGLGVMF